MPMTYDEIEMACRDLSVQEIDTLTGALHRLGLKARQHESTRMRALSAHDLAKEVAGDWGGYGVPDSMVTPAYPREELQAENDETIRQLNIAGGRLIEALRNLKQPDYREPGAQLDVAPVKLALADVFKLQVTYSKFGFNDTEGRETLWAVYRAVLDNTDIDTSMVWELTY